MIESPATDDPVWYVAYASNLSIDRLRCYLQGGRPRGALRTYEGARDPSPPTRDVTLTLSGDLFFAGSSTVWTGGMAFYDSSTSGEIVARGYQVTFGQLSDLVSQETRQPVGHDLRPDEQGDRWPTRSPVYDSVKHLGELDDRPMFCLTSQAALDLAPPSAAYLRTILVGLRETLGWSAAESARYLLGARGVVPEWSQARISALDLGDVTSRLPKSDSGWNTRRDPRVGVPDRVHGELHPSLVGDDLGEPVPRQTSRPDHLGLRPAGCPGAWRRSAGPGARHIDSA